jgi:hypothetical protein
VRADLGSALRMVASRELRCSRHAEDSSDASPSQDGGEPVASWCGLIVEGALETAKVYLSMVTVTVPVPASAAPSRAE